MLHPNLNAFVSGLHSFRESPADGGVARQGLEHFFKFETATLIPVLAGGKVGLPSRQ